jgi:hypothetical protein
LLNTPTLDIGSYNFFHLEDILKKNKLEMSFVYETLESETGTVYGPQIKIFGERTITEQSTNEVQSASSIMSTFDKDPVSGFSGFPLNAWIHVAIVSILSETHAGDVMPKERTNIGLLYLNGVLSVESSFPHLSRTLYTNNWIGHKDVLFDELRMYDSYQAEADIRKLMIRRLDIDQKPLLSSLAVYFNFDDGIQEFLTGLSSIRSISSSLSSESENVFILNSELNHHSWVYKSENSYMPYQRQWLSTRRNKGFTVSVTVQSSTRKMANEQRVTLKLRPTNQQSETPPIGPTLDHLNAEGIIGCETSTKKYNESINNHTGVQEPIHDTCRMEYQGEPYSCNNDGSYCTDTKIRYYSKGVKNYEFDVYICRRSKSQEEKI